MVKAWSKLHSQLGGVLAAELHAAEQVEPAGESDPRLQARVSVGLTQPHAHAAAAKQEGAGELEESCDLVSAMYGRFPAEYGR